MSTPTTATQNLDHVTTLATHYVEEHLDGDPLQWGDVLDHLKARGYADEATAAITRAVLDLERTSAMFYALEGMRRPLPGDAEGAPIDEVAAAVLSLAWPCTRNNRPGGQPVDLRGV
jgi:hypothetical protein